jgi:hypothetical protein
MTTSPDDRWDAFCRGIERKKRWHPFFLVFPPEPLGGWQFHIGGVYRAGRPHGMWSVLWHPYWLVPIGVRYGGF